jgi:O-methyltransferase domain/Dimerisation domain
MTHPIPSFDQQPASSSEVLLDLLTGGWVAQMITAVTDLGVADALAGGPLPIKDLAGRVGADPDALGRVLRALITKGIFAHRADGRYELTPMAELLRSDAPLSLAALAQWIGAPQEHEHWSKLTEALRTGVSPVSALRGKPYFDYLRDEPEFSRVFNQAMVNLSAYLDGPLVTSYDFSRYKTVVDVAGGHGRLLAAILASAPDARGVLFDLPDVVAGAQPLLEEMRVADRVQLALGSFFEEVPAGGDAYVLKHIIHDWCDHDALRILRNVRRAAACGAKLLLIETVIPDDHGEFRGKLTDVAMLVFNGGRERTAQEYRRLLDNAGFEMVEVLGTGTEFSIVEASAV